MEKEVRISKIKGLLEDINQITNEDRTGSNKLSRFVDSILTELIGLNSIDSSMDYEGMISTLSHTSDKELYYVEYANNARIKKNAVAKRQTEYNHELFKAIRQINMDLTEIIDHIGEINKSK